MSGTRLKLGIKPRTFGSQAVSHGTCRYSCAPLKLRLTSYFGLYTLSVRGETIFIFLFASQGFFYITKNVYHKVEIIFIWFISMIYDCINII
jgi:hypothetical protein